MFVALSSIFAALLRDCLAFAPRRRSPAARNHSQPFSQGRDSSSRHTTFFAFSPARFPRFFFRNVPIESARIVSDGKAGCSSAMRRSLFSIPAFIQVFSSFPPCCVRQAYEYETLRQNSNSRLVVFYEFVVWGCFNGGGKWRRLHYSEIIFTFHNGSDIRYNAQPH